MSNEHLGAYVTVAFVLINLTLGLTILIKTAKGNKS